MKETDIDKLKKLLDEFGVPYKVYKDSKKSDGGMFDDLVIEQNSISNKVDGYTGFYISFEFEKSGDFIRCGAWE